MRKGLWGAAAAVLAAAWVSGAMAADPPRLLQHPSLSASQIAFDYAGEIWTVPRDGGKATAVVVGQGQNSRPVFSPDGRWIAFSGRYDGNLDVYVVPAAGGEPRRLTWHPGGDIALGWTPDGKRILFSSPRATNRDTDNLFTIAMTGGPARMEPLPSGEVGSYSPDGTHLAYLPFYAPQPAWKNYRGGATMHIWIANLADSTVEKIPRENSNDRNPMWVGDSIYFLSDRNGPVSLYAFDTRTKAVKPLVDNAHGLDVASASAGPGGIVYDAFGALKIYDTASGRSHTVPVSLSAELPQLRPRFEPLKPDQILHVALTPAGKRVLIEAHGEILSAPAEKGDIRNLTQSPGVADRDPAASPDGKQVAWFSDESGEYALHIRAADGQGPVKKIALGDPPSFFYAPRWAPDSQKLVFFDKRLMVWMVDLAKGGAPVKIDTDLFDSPLYRPDTGWSPDSRWIAYTKQLPSHLHAAFVYSLDSGKSVQVTDGLSDAASPRFDRSGDYLYFTASTSTGLGAGWLDMSSYARPADAAVYAVVLRKDQASPVGPESDEEGKPEEAKPGAVKPTTDKDETPKTAKKAAAEAAAKPVKQTRIDFDHLDQRVVALPIPHARFADLMTGTDGIVFTVTEPLSISDEDQNAAQGGPDQTLFRFDLKTRKNEHLVEGIDNGSAAVSADGSKILYARQNQWTLAASEKPPKPADETKLKLADLSVWVDPRAEWRQMYHETWRIERDFLYDPKAQGLDLARAEKVYAPFLDGLAGRQDLNTLFEEMTGQLGLGHVFVRGGALPSQTQVKVGLLGADYDVDAGRYRIKRILRGENWNPSLQAPLSQPGVNVAEGEYLLAVNGREVTADAEVYRAFEGLAGKQTVITVGPKADGTGARKVTVVPVASETALRLRSWMEANRQQVDRLSGGRLAYVYLPDTATGGYANFNRYYYAQVGKQGAIIDERFNHGGQIADYIVEQLGRTPNFVNATREGEEVVEPAQAIFGPKVMLINELSGSGGDALPYLFRFHAAGTLVGKRTWGGLVGIGNYPPLIDGGTVTAPRWALYGTRGQWEVENLGIPPDVDVEQDPAAMRSGADPQLERAVAVALDALGKTPPAKFVRPAYPDRKPVLPGN
ncbi:S41 family peptidase [Phenylobacterium sp.]|uniref:S41 family peptidase n=1 Tax=Phenylobacterium sp. TaxID=1871053 RepID=UPI0025E8A551|nr:S41 family peptidase [Phenylobacterium sp.]